MKFSQKSEYFWTFIVQLFFLYQTMSGDGGDGFKNRRRNEKMREDSAFKEDEAIFIIFQYGIFGAMYFPM